MIVPLTVILDLLLAYLTASFLCHFALTGQLIAGFCENLLTASYLVSMQGRPRCAAFAGLEIRDRFCEHARQLPQQEVDTNRTAYSEEESQDI
jgi:hypothetical protein